MMGNYAAHTVAEDTVRRIREEGAISMAQAAELFGLQRNGKLRHHNTIALYCTRGVSRGGKWIRLEGYRGPAGWMTSAQAIERFLVRLHELAVEEEERLTSPKAVEVVGARKRREGGGAGGTGEMTATEIALRELDRLKKGRKFSGGNASESNG
jgi:hypothetical protein